MENGLNGPLKTPVIIIFNIDHGLFLGNAWRGGYVRGAAQRSKLCNDDNELHDEVQHEVTAPGVEVVDGEFQFL